MCNINKLENIIKDQICFNKNCIKVANSVITKKNCKIKIQVYKEILNDIYEIKHGLK